MLGRSVADDDNKPERKTSHTRRPLQPSRSDWADAGLAMTIPFLMACGPLVGYALGWLIRRATGWGHWVEAVMALIGLAAGIREAIRVIRKLPK